MSSKTRKDLENCYRFKRGLGIRIFFLNLLSCNRIFFLNLLSCNEYKYNLGSVTRNNGIRNSMEQGIVWNKEQYGIRNKGEYVIRNIIEQETVRN